MQIEMILILPFKYLCFLYIVVVLLQQLIPPLQQRIEGLRRHVLAFFPDIRRKTFNILR